MRKTNGTTPTPEGATPDDGDELRVSRPDWMPAEAWDEIKVKHREHLDELVRGFEADRISAAVAASPDGGCSELAWCTMGQSDGHLDFHSNEAVNLAGFVDTGQGFEGWWAWATLDRGHRLPRIVVEGEGHGSLDLSVRAVRGVLDATADAKSRRALRRLLDEVCTG